VDKIKRRKVLHARGNLGSHKLQVSITEETHKKRESSLWKQEAMKGTHSKVDIKPGLKLQHIILILNESL
jgi:hypothetical protein